MKHNFKKLVSLVLVLAISLAVSVPAFAAEKSNGKDDIVSMFNDAAQRYQVSVKRGQIITK